MPARLEVIAGPMFSGKSEELIRRLKREAFAKRAVHALKPHVDTRTGIKASIAARAVGTDGESRIVQEYDAVAPIGPDGLRYELGLPFDTFAFDEGQFFPKDLAPAIGELLTRRKADNVLVLVAGLDLDYRLRPFGPMPNLMAMADSVTKLDAVCMKCHQHGARFTQRITGSTDQVQVGDVGSYEVRCRKCHYIFGEEQPTP